MKELLAVSQQRQVVTAVLLLKLPNDVGTQNSGGRAIHAKCTSGSNYCLDIISTVEVGMRLCRHVQKSSCISCISLVGGKPALEATMFSGKKEN